MEEKMCYKKKKKKKKKKKEKSRAKGIRNVGRGGDNKQDGQRRPSPYEI